ncbi:PREDICTED: tRNA (guanine-N(7)-)-methyltransferase non-catalytic subunit wdr4 [Tarenaya hassleriana]|uniref:tRNA (guanine-N(7)-)-methyltransferase non-catalytic subunit wdr4 n=1 Tax=Tarenaya hassleriana TaxID=28532 RepID=UPI00053C2841|nr:PREDICTED: tRNA (guanine-N(7)-)-methyltransferase non-catalytic subunit wdr4 [Tarenaya hassleriana]
MEDSHIEDGETQGNVEVAPALISVHPSQNSVAVSVGSDLRVFDLVDKCPATLVDDSGGPSHKDSIRAIRYGANGRLFVSAGDDKLVKIWSVGSWHCISTVCSEKRVTAVAISNDGLHVCYADKFGVVWVVELDGINEGKVLPSKKTAPMLSHYCSIITSLEFSPDDCYILSADRDFKIRVTVFPKKPLEGAHEIQSFCLGHTEFVKCLAFVRTPEFPQGYLVSGSGDSTVRLWDITSGSLLDTCNVSTKAGHVESDEGEPTQCTVTDICTIPNSSLVAVAIQSLQGIMLLSCDVLARNLSITKVITIPGESFIPTSICMGVSSSTKELLVWLVTGASNLPSSSHPSFSRVRAISLSKKPDGEAIDNGHSVVEDELIPGGMKLLEKLQGKVSIEEEVICAATEAVRTAMSSLLMKKQYSSEKREFRKRTRNDKKNVH